MYSLIANKIMHNFQIGFEFEKTLLKIKPIFGQFFNEKASKVILF